MAQNPNTSHVPNKKPTHSTKYETLKLQYYLVSKIKNII